MITCRRASIALAASILILAIPRSASAQVEIEVDPLAFALDGFSLNVGTVFGQLRASVGTFGIDVPHSLHRRDGFDMTMRGAGLKVDWLGKDAWGWFAGADASYYRNSYVAHDLRQTSQREEYVFGVRGGYRLPIGRSGLYLAPWVGVGFNFPEGDIHFNGKTFENRAITVLPALHIGWRF